MKLIEVIHKIDGSQTHYILQVIRLQNKTPRNIFPRDCSVKHCFYKPLKMANLFDTCLLNPFLSCRDEENNLIT